MKLEKADKTQLRWMKKLYKTAFPKQERKPFWLMKRKQKQGIFEMLVVYDNEPLGLAITMRHKDIVLLDYYAIAPQARGKGVGSEALALLKKRYTGKRFFLEIEIPDIDAANGEQRERRKAFYLRNGMIEIGMQACVAGVEMEILTNRCDLSYQEYQEVYESCLGSSLARRIIQPLEGK